MKLKVLFVGDPNLGMKGLAITRECFPEVQAIIWKRGDKAGRKAARDLIRSQRWDVAISFYNDLLFKPEDLRAIALPLNIHPASPDMPGVGYDTVPVLEKHETHGATLHTMNEKIDDGKILDVLEQALPTPLTGKSLRKRNQLLCLELLEKTVSEIAQAESWKEAEARLQSRGNGKGRTWSDSYVSKKDVRILLEELKTSDPEHPVFA